MWIAYIISNAVAAVLLLFSWKFPRLARLLFALLFGGASWINAKTALNSPGMYLDFAPYAIPAYRNFIEGWFAGHATQMVLMIAAGQALIALAMPARGLVFRLGCLGGMLFLLGIAPLGFGSAFPFSLTAGAGLWLLFRRSDTRWLWEKT